MLGKRIIYCLFLLTLNSLPLTLLAEDNKPVNKKGYYYAIVRFGVDQPVTSSGNTNINSAQTTYSAGTELGKKINEKFALSIEYKKIGNSTFKISDTIHNETTYSATWSGKSDVFLANLSLDLIENSTTIPYVKAGIGTAFNQASNFIVSNTKTAIQEVYSNNTSSKFAWQIGAGLNVTCNELFDIDINYMFLDRGKMSTKTGFTVSGVSVDPTSPARETNLKDHMVSLGFKVKF